MILNEESVCESQRELIHDVVVAYNDSGSNEARAKVFRDGETDAHTLFNNVLFLCGFYAKFTPPIMGTNILIGGIIMKNCQVIFDVKGLENSTFVGIKELKDVMGDELLRVYNIYANKANGGLTKMLNEEFKKLYPTYFEDNKDKEWYELVEYNSYMSDGYQRLIVDDLNKQNISPILDFYVDSTEIVFTGYLKLDKKVTISFSLKEV